jgi:hypothetical protein
MSDVPENAPERNTYIIKSKTKDMFDKIVMFDSQS